MRRISTIIRSPVGSRAMVGLGCPACQTENRDSCHAPKPANLAGGIGEGTMRLVLFQPPGRDEPVPGLLTDRGVVDVSGITEKGHTPQSTMQALIDGFDRLRPSLERRA